MTSKNRFLFLRRRFFTGKIPGNELLRLSRHLFGCDRTVVIGISRRDCQQRDADQNAIIFLVFFIFSIFLSGDHPIGLYGTKLRTDFGANLEFRYFNKIFFRTRLYISIPRSETGRYASTFLRERDFGQSQNR